MSKPSPVIKTFILSVLVVGIVVLSITLVQQRKLIASLTNELENIQNPSVAVPTNNSDLPKGVSWLSYTDADISFPYPKTFVASPFHEDEDLDAKSTQWTVNRIKDTVYIHPNFESPAVEFGATYEIRIVESKSEAEQLAISISNDTTQSSKNLCHVVKDVPIKNYDVCIHERMTDEGLGRVGMSYILLPKEDFSGPTLFLFDMSGGMYTNYIRGVLIPQMKINE